MMPKNWILKAERRPHSGWRDDEADSDVAVGVVDRSIADWIAALARAALAALCLDMRVEPLLMAELLSTEMTVVRHISSMDVIVHL